MIGLKTDIKTKWKNYVIKADAEKARYHKVEYGTDNLYAVISATGLVPGKKYTFSARIRLNIQETDAKKVFEFHAYVKNSIKWYSAPGQPISGKGDIDEFLSVTITPPEDANENTIWNIGVSCMRPEWYYVPHDGDYYIFEKVMVNGGDKPLPYIDPE